MVNWAKMIVCGLSLACLLSGSVEAREIVGFPLRVDSTLVSSGAAQERIPGMKSGTIALLWSFLGTAVPAAVGARSSAGIVLVGGLVIGPSLGHFYAARPGRALVGIGIRTVAGTGIAVALAEEFVSEGGQKEINGLAIVSFVLGGASLAWDIIGAPHSARVHNEQVRQDRVAIGITPSIGVAGLGLRAEVSF